MKKGLTLVIVLLLCLATVFALAACEFKAMDGSESYVSFEKERSVELVHDFFEVTLQDPDFIVTCTNAEGEEVYTETVKGTDSYTAYKNGSQIYAFKKGGFFYVATIARGSDEEGKATEQHSYLCSDSSKKGYYGGGELGTMEDIYKKNHCAFMNSISGVGIVDDLTEQDAAFECRVNIEREGGSSTGSLRFSYTAASRTVTITASSVDDRVTSLRVVISNTDKGGDSSDLTRTFVYGVASVTLPNVDAWDKE